MLPKLTVLSYLNLRDLLQKTPTAGAMGYCLRLWDALTRYLDDGRIKIDNNAAERALRVEAVGGKNWIFAGSEKGGHAAACMCTMIESAKACGLNPREYLEDLLRRLPSTLQRDINTLLPQNWKPLTPQISCGVGGADAYEPSEPNSHSPTRLREERNV